MIAFAVLDWSYVDKQNYKLFNKFGLTRDDQPTFIALSDPKSGNIFKSQKIYSGDNFD